MFSLSASQWVFFFTGFRYLRQESAPREEGPYLERRRWLILLGEMTKRIPHFISTTH